MDGFADLFFDVQSSFANYRNGVENHVRELRRLIQAHDHLAPHELDGEGWSLYLKSKRVVT